MPIGPPGTPPRGRSAGGARPGAPRDTDHEEFAVPPIRRDTHPVGDQSSAPPVMPSFDSLRGPRRRSAVDLLVPGAPPAPAPAPAPAAAAAGRPAPPRPPDYADLLRLGVLVARAVVELPGRVARWSFRAPERCLRRVFGAEPTA